MQQNFVIIRTVTSNGGCRKTSENFFFSIKWTECLLFLRSTISACHWTLDYFKKCNLSFRMREKMARKTFT